MFVFRSVQMCARSARACQGEVRRRWLDGKYLGLDRAIGAHDARTCTLCRAFGGLRARDVEVLHRESPHPAWLLEARDDAAAPRAAGEKGSGALRIADGGGKADAPGVHARHAREPLDKAERLPAAVAAQERVNLVDDDKAQVMEQARDGHVLMHEECLERFRRNLQDAARMLQELALMRGGHIAMPVPDGNLGLLAQVV